MGKMVRETTTVRQSEAGVPEPQEEYEFRCYIKNAKLDKPQRAFMRVQLRRYVCATEWSSKKEDCRWDEELRGFKVKSLDDNVRIKLLIHKHGDAKVIDKITIPLWKINQAGGELRNKFYFNDRTPVNMILSLIKVGGETEQQIEEASDDESSDLVEI